VEWPATDRVDPSTNRHISGIGRQIMATSQRYFNDLNRLLKDMPPGMPDMYLIEANERLHGHRFYDPPETVFQWLLDQQRRVQTG
jgi:hypothetical protein